MARAAKEIPTGHNSFNPERKQHLRDLTKRIVTLRLERAKIVAEFQADERDLFAEVRAARFVPKVVRELVVETIRKQSDAYQTDLAMDQRRVKELYRDILGLGDDI